MKLFSSSLNEPKGRSLDVLAVHQNLDDVFADLFSGDGVRQATQLRFLYRYGFAIGTCGRHKGILYRVFATRHVNVESRNGIYR